MYDYAAGKEDWSAAGLPVEGHVLEHPRAMDALSEVATCRLSDTVGAARSQLNEGDRRTVIVTAEDGVVLGRLRREALQADGETPVEDVMEIGPTTFRANVLLQPLVERMHEKKVGSVVITNADGQLLGMLYRDEGEQVLRARQGGPGER